MPENLCGVHSDSRSHASTAPLPEICATVHQKVEAFLSTEPPTERLKEVQRKSRLSLEVLEEALERYSLDELSLSYNGGKDCLVLLILYLSALHAHSTKARKADAVNNSYSHPPSAQLPQTLQTVHILSKHPFPQVDDFVASSAHSYHLDIARYAMPMKEALSNYLSDCPHVKAIFVGTRRTDPHGADLKHFDPTDHGWPPFMRIHPVIDWHYAEIWSFIRELEIPYCSLYDLGYTSLGGTTDTHPNPALKEAVGAGITETHYRPAYELVADDEERLGRDK